MGIEIKDDFNMTEEEIEQELEEFQKSSTIDSEHRTILSMLPKYREW